MMMRIMILMMMMMLVVMVMMMLLMMMIMIPMKREMMMIMMDDEEDAAPSISPHTFVHPSVKVLREQPILCRHREHQRTSAGGASRCGAVDGTYTLMADRTSTSHHLHHHHVMQHSLLSYSHQVMQYSLLSHSHHHASTVQVQIIAHALPVTGNQLYSVVITANGQVN